MSRTHAERLAIAIALVAGALMLLGVARASALGQITFGGCVSKDGTAGQCAGVDGDPLFGAKDVAISPDGSSAYVAAFHGDAIGVFNRAPAGQLTYAGCISNTGSGGACADIPGIPFTAPEAIAVSPDGNTVYAGTLGSDVVAVFDRAAGGQLTWGGCVGNDDQAGTCTDLPGSPLTDVEDLAVSPDGRSVYVVARNSGMVTVLDRAPGGQLTYGGCVSSSGTAGACGVAGPSLSTPSAVAVSPDGGSVLVTDAAADATLVFDRAAAGQITFAGCVSDDGTSGACAELPGSPLNGAYAVALSPDGRNVYVAAETASAVAVLDRAPAGELTWGGCVSDNGSGGFCANAAGDTLANLESVAISPDGASVYVTSGATDAVSVFDRAAGGQIVYAGCVSGDGSGGTCGTANVAQDYPAAVAVSPDGGSVYSVSLFAHSVQHYFRKTAPQTTIDSGPGDGETTADARPTFAFSADRSGAGFECSVDGGTFTACISPHMLGPLSDGPHSFAVRAITGGDPDLTPARRSFTVATTGVAKTRPAVRFTKRPKRSLRTAKRRIKVTIGFDSTEPNATFECKLDGGPFTPCSSPHGYRVRPGRHTVAVRATDRLGNTGPVAKAGFRVRRAARR